MGHGYLRGHEIYCKNGGPWKYVDDDTLTQDIPFRDHCGFCKLKYNDSDHDPCIENLPDVQNACCGHGEEWPAYIQYKNKNIISGKNALLIFDKLGKGPNYV